MYVNPGWLAFYHECSNPKSRAALPGIRDLCRTYLWFFAHQPKFAFDHLVVLDRPTEYHSDRVLSAVHTHNEIGFYFAGKFARMYFACAGNIRGPVAIAILSMYQRHNCICIRIFVNDKQYYCKVATESLQRSIIQNEVILSFAPCELIYDKYQICGNSKYFRKGAQIVSKTGKSIYDIDVKVSHYYDGQYWYQLHRTGQVFRYLMPMTNTLAMCGPEQWM